MQLQLQHINQRKKLLPLLTRQEHLKALKENEFDVLVIGGGATGKHLAIRDGVTFFSVEGPSK